LGTHNLTAEYSGDGAYNAATSNTLVQTVVLPNTAPGAPTITN
jgi:hypothetical protein